jgi:hypothetical protein
MDNLKKLKQKVKDYSAYKKAIKKCLKKNVKIILKNKIT